MAFLVSPGVHVREIDLTNVVPAVQTTIGAIAGPFEKGPVSSVTTVGSEEELVEVFGKPNADNFEWWFTASNFLQYADSLRVVRPESAIVNAGEASGVLIRDDEHYLDSYYSETGDGQVTSNDWYARSAGTWGNSLGLQVCPSRTSFRQDCGVGNLVDGAVTAGATTVTVDDADATGFAFFVGDIIKFHTNDSITATSNGAITTASKNLTVDGNSGTIAVGQRVIGAGIDEIVTVVTVTSQTALVLDKAITIADNVSMAFSAYADVEANNTEYEVVSISSETLTVRLLDDPNGAGIQTAIADNSFIERRWKFSDLFTGPPDRSAWSIANSRGDNDELHVVVYDTTGDITGFDSTAAGQRTSGVIETHGFLSKNPYAKSPQGDNIYYPNKIFRTSKYVYWGDHISTGSNWGTDTTSDYTAVTIITVVAMTGGTDDYSVTAGELSLAYDKLQDTEAVDKYSNCV